MDLFAYLIYKNGILCSNGELLGVLWNGDPSKDSRLRQIVLDMRSSFAEIGAENIVLKKYGKVGIDMEQIEISGELSEIEEQFDCY